MEARVGVQGTGTGARLQRWTDLVTEAGLAGWLVADFRWNNPLFARLLGLGSGILTRRAFLWLPGLGRGEPCVIASRVDGHTVAGLDCAVRLYSGYEEMTAMLQTLLPRGERIAMEYVERGVLPTVSRVDGGLLDLVRACGVTVVSSGSLIAMLEAWDERQRALHEQAAHVVDEARRLALGWCAERLARGEQISEGAVVAVIGAHFADRGVEPGGYPDVATGANAADPHYSIGAEAGAPIQQDAVLLIDLWGRVRDAADAPYADSTWMAYVGAQPPEEVTRAFEAARDARDAAVEAIAGATRARASIAGRAADRAARQVLIERGYAEAIVHRTGHSLGIDHVHGMGTNLDDVEFPDDRLLVPYSGFTVEPGLYFPGRFGIRLEVSAILLPEGPRLSTERQDTLTLIAGPG
jgi:Xaa-Pro aminopeptidase